MVEKLVQQLVDYLAELWVHVMVAKLVDAKVAKMVGKWEAYLVEQRVCVVVAL